MQEERSALGRALNALRRPVVGTCARCGAEFTAQYTSRKNPRRYCKASCRQMDYFERRRQAASPPPPVP